jgi:dipeptidyl-peptidase-4
VFRSLRCCFVVVPLLSALALPLIAAKKPVTIDALIDAPSNRHGPIFWAPDGARFIANERGMLSLYEVRSGKSREIVSLDTLEKAAVKPLQPPLYDWTNRRVDESDVQWFTDGKRILVAASGDLFIVDLASGRFDALTDTPDFERDPKLSPDNRSVSFRRGADLYVIDVASRMVTRLTSNGSDTLLNGQLDWVYPEELDLGTAHWWSPDSRSIAYLQFDIAREPVFPQVSLLNPRGVLEPERYPKPGDPNAEVRLGIVPLPGGETKWMDLGDPRGFLIARVVWAPSSREILAERLPRVQNKLELLMADVATGASRVVLREEDPTWINVGGEPRFLAGGSRFLWTSERSGFRHLYVYGVDGTLQKQLTSGAWEVAHVAGVDEEHQRVYYTSTQDSPVERQLYAVSLAGGVAQRLTKETGTHSISMAPNAAYYLDDYSSLATPPESRLYRSDGKDGKEEREYRPADRKASEEYEILPTEIVQVKATDGTLLYARMIKPAGFQAGKKYPAVVTVYGGPGVQEIRNSWQGLSWDQVLAQKGFVIWQLDNRGSSGRGHAFESPIYHNMGAQEMKDQVEGIRYLISQGFVDARRIGLYGWSYGGYMTLYTVTHTPDLIKAAIAGAPVTNWRNYDSIYTERYMGLPENDEEGYRASAPALNAAGMSGTKLLIVHNVEDDNVHFQNSLQMADALEKAGKQFFMVVYPQKTHHVAGPAYKQLLETITAFFEENLKP